MSIVIKKLPILDGYRFYPIEYKEKKYMAEIAILYPRFHPDKITVIDIYEYNEKRKFFKKGKFFYGKEFDVVPVEKDAYLNMHAITREDLLMYYPQIISFLFKEYERETNEANSEYQKKEQQKEKAASWDGVVR